MKRNLKQKLINLVEYYNLINANFLLNNTPLKRSMKKKTSILTGSKLEELIELKKKNSIYKKL